MSVDRKLGTAMYTIKQAASRLNVSVKTVYRLCQGGLEHYRLGGAIRIDEAQIQRYLEKNRRAECTEPQFLRRPPRIQLRHLRLDP